MASLRGALHEKFPTTYNLSELTAGLNEFVYTSSDSHCFISFFLAVVDRRKDELAYVNAGHNPPVIVGPEGAPRVLASTGLCLGMFAGQTYEEKTLPLGPGDVLCLYTDGIVESRKDKQEDFGDGRLVDRLKGSGSLASREILEKIYEDVFAFSGCAEAGDDMTLVVVKRNP
jgi:sigma-B regulation protein RsbU (phosphoserine phosphatase)